MLLCMREREGAYATCIQVPMGWKRVSDSPGDRVTGSFELQDKLGFSEERCHSSHCLFYFLFFFWTWRGNPVPHTPQLSTVLLSYSLTLNFLLLLL